MPGRIVLYGATGYTGALTAQAMVASGARPVLAGRDQSRLSALAARLSQAGPVDPGRDREPPGDGGLPASTGCTPPGAAVARLADPGPARRTRTGSSAGPIRCARGRSP